MKDSERKDTVQDEEVQMELKEMLKRLMFPEESGSSEVK